MMNRRQFNQGLVAMAFGGLASHLHASQSRLQTTAMAQNTAYGKLIPDPNALLDLPSGFNYQVISRLGDKMQDDLDVPDRADGMGCFYLDDKRVVLIRNHEIAANKLIKKHHGDKQAMMLELAYDTFENTYPLPGGTSSIVYNLQSKRVEQQFMSLIGTIRNCSGGVTPWETWLTCEESVDKADKMISKDHGYVFEVPANATKMVNAIPIKAMGRFNHEAACVDPRTGIVYMTEDRNDSLIYRYIPNQKANLQAGGRLQALVIAQQPKFDTRNWHSGSMPLNQEMAVEWVELDHPESPNDDLRLRGFNAGAALFARGEGIHWGDNELYFCCTNGGAKKLGQIMRYVPSLVEGSPSENKRPGKLSLFVESEYPQTMNFADNVTVAPNGHLIVCEDQYTDHTENHIKGVTPDGKTYDLARVRLQTEPAGACFSPDGRTLFVNLYSPTTTVAITGPWDRFIS
jgi:secreted PhoX family phosphatase